MNAEQFLKQVLINRDLVVRKNETAHEHLQMLTTSYDHLITGKAAIMLDMNKALIKLNFESDYGAAMDISLNTIEKFKHSPFKTALAFHMKMVAHCNLYLGQYDIATRYLQEAIDTLSPEEEDYTSHKADMLCALAQAEEHKDAKSAKMPEYLLAALNLLNREEDSLRKANCLLGLGNYYNNIEQPAEALKHFEQAAASFEKQYLLHHMANAYSNMGISYLQLKDYTRSHQYMQKALDIRVKADSADTLAISYSNFGRLYMLTGQLDKAEDALNTSQRIAEDIGFKQLIEKNEELFKELSDLKKRSTS